jgi:hypothetical protein
MPNVPLTGVTLRYCSGSPARAAWAERHGLISPPHTGRNSSNQSPKRHRAGMVSQKPRAVHRS